MSRLIFFVKRYKFFILLLLVNFAVLLATPEIGNCAFSITRGNLKEVMSVLPPIFILLGLLDVWVERETLIKYLGSGAGIKGALLAFALGSFAAGPLYAAFPIAGILLKKGAKLTYVFIFVGAWATTKVPMMLFEAANLGLNYMLLRWTFNIVGIVVISFLLERSLSAKEQEEIYAQAKKLG